MPENGFFEATGPPVVQISFAATNTGGQADAPERRRAPLGTGSHSLTHIVSQTNAHIVQQEVGVRMNGLVAKFGHGMVRAGGECRRMTLHAISAGEKLLTVQCLGVGQISTGVDTKSRNVRRRPEVSRNSYRICALAGY